MKTLDRRSAKRLGEARAFGIKACALLGMTLALQGCVPTINPLVPIRIEIDDVVSPQSQIGDEVEIRWSYPSSLLPEKQDYVLVRHTILGSVREEIDLEEDDRSLTFTFQGPTTVFVRAFEDEDETEPFSEVAVEIRYDTDYFFEALVTTSVPATGDPVSTVLAETAARNYPRLDYPAASFTQPESSFTKRIRFTSFLGIRNQFPDEFIDFFVLNAPQFELNSPFRMVSLTRNEAEGFDAVEGVAFPEICHEALVPERCHASADPPDTFKSISHANALVFGGALAYGGTPETVITSKDGSTIVYRDPETEGEPIFMLIALSSGLANTFFDETGKLEVVDIFVGNAAQKLVLSAFWGTSQSDADLGEPEADYETVGPENLTLKGSIKDAYIIDTLELDLFEKFPLNFRITDASWNVPFRRDDDLLGLPTAVHLCELDETCEEVP